MSTLYPAWQLAPQSTNRVAQPLFGGHSIMMEKLAQGCWGSGGASLSLPLCTLWLAPERNREKGRGAIWECTGSYILLVLLGRGWWGRHKSIGGGRYLIEWKVDRKTPPPSASWVENNMTRPLNVSTKVTISSPRNKGGGYTLAWRRGGWGVNILEDERKRIALFQ